MTTARDRLWLFSVAAGTDDTHYGIPLSRVTPVEAAFYLDIPNTMVIVEKNVPYPTEMYLRAMRPLSQVVWSVVDSGGVHGWADGREVEVLCDLSTRFPNITGVYMDDFFNPKGDDGQAGAFSVERLRAIRGQLQMPHRTLKLWAVLYTHQVDMGVEKHLELCDYVSYWTWRADELTDLEKNLSRLEALGVPAEKISLGLYMWDYGGRRPIPMDLMKRQCELGLQWLVEGRVDNLCFLGSYLCDLDIEAVEWTREWIQDIKDRPVPERTNND